MTLSRRTLLWSLGLALPAGLALTVRRKLHGSETKWRGKWKGQYSYRTLPYDEALEIVFDRKAPRSFKGSAAHRVHNETAKLIDEAMTILGSGKAAQQMQRLNHIALVVPIGLQALISWSQQTEQGKRGAPVLIRDLVGRLRG
jgi:hypothetical protein